VKIIQNFLYTCIIFSQDKISSNNYWNYSLLHIKIHENGLLRYTCLLRVSQASTCICPVLSNQKCMYVFYHRIHMYPFSKYVFLHHWGLVNNLIKKELVRICMRRELVWHQYWLATTSCQQDSEYPHLPEARDK